MPEVTFGRLADLAPREAWAHEAHVFTPWLASNIEQLAEAIGIPLELMDTEVPVERFAADILARNPADGSVVLIENQLEQADHSHLGQILTYLAGLEAQTVIWLAPHFREAHLSAVRWLNMHTADGFSFFAVRLRTVRIGDSPIAPIFEILERPNVWERKLTEIKREATSRSDLTERRGAFWSAYIERYPAASEWGLTGTERRSSVWVPVPRSSPPAFISLWLGDQRSGAFLRPAKGADPSPLVGKLKPFADELSDRLNAAFDRGTGFYVVKQVGLGLQDAERRSELIDWLESTRQDYLSVLGDIFSRETSAA